MDGFVTLQLYSFINWKYMEDRYSYNWQVNNHRKPINFLFINRNIIVNSIYKGNKIDFEIWYKQFYSLLTCHLLIYLLWLLVLKEIIWQTCTEARVLLTSKTSNSIVFIISFDLLFSRAKLLQLKFNWRRKIQFNSNRK